MIVNYEIIYNDLLTLSLFLSLICICSFLYRNSGPLNELKIILTLGNPMVLHNENVQNVGNQIKENLTFP